MSELQQRVIHTCMQGQRPRFLLLPIGRKKACVCVGFPPLTVEVSPRGLSMQLTSPSCVLCIRFFRSRSMHLDEDFHLPQPAAASPFATAAGAAAATTNFTHDSPFCNNNNNNNSSNGYHPITTSAHPAGPQGYDSHDLLKHSSAQLFQQQQQQQLAAGGLAPSSLAKSLSLPLHTSAFSSAAATAAEQRFQQQQQQTACGEASMQSAFHALSRSGSLHLPGDTSTGHAAMTHQYHQSHQQQQQLQAHHRRPHRSSSDSLHASAPNSLASTLSSQGSLPGGLLSDAALLHASRSAASSPSPYADSGLFGMALHQQQQQQYNRLPPGFTNSANALTTARSMDHAAAAAATAVLGSRLPPLHTSGANPSANPFDGGLDVPARYPSATRDTSSSSTTNNSRLKRMNSGRIQSPAPLPTHPYHNHNQQQSQQKLSLGTTTAGVLQFSQPQQQSQHGGNGGGYGLTRSMSVDVATLMQQRNHHQQQQQQQQLQSQLSLVPGGFAASWQTLERQGSGGGRGGIGAVYDMKR